MITTSTSTQAGRSRQRTGEGVTPAGPSAIPPIAPNGPVGRRNGRWRLSNWRLRWKLLIVLLVPLITAVALGALRVTSQLQSAGVYDDISQQIALSSSLSDVMDAVQHEREQTALYVTSGRTSGSPPGGAAAASTDASVLSFKQLVASDSDLDSTTQAAVTNSLNAIGDLNALRSFAKGSKFPDVDVLNGYDQILNTLLQSSQLVNVSAPDQRVNQLVQGLFDLRTAKEEFTRSNAILMMTVTPVTNADGTVSNNWQFLPGTEDLLNSSQAQYTSSIASFNSQASQNDLQMFQDTVTGPDVDDRAQLLTLIQTRADQNAGPPSASVISVQPTTVQHAGDGAATLLRKAEVTLDNELTGDVNVLATQSKDQAIQDGAILAAALLIAFLVTLFVARSLVQSLRRLRSGALEVARTKLPQSVQRILADPDPIKASNRSVDPVPVFTADEIGEVARSFDVVHGQAVRLAAEQAVLRDNVNAIFINLSRRSQALVERQLALIDRLEKDEQDPDQLANLFELDHLATRMRRNSESLLVLSGSGLAKRMSRPVPIGELVGAAVSEVEQYARIDVGAPPPASVLGRVVNDLIHLIAELLDNATSYSEPNTRVSVRIARTRSRELAIQVTDRGVGMSEDDVRLANERLANPPDIDVGVTRRMGLYVVARLARRHNIRVKLRANEDIDGGTVALIVIPEDLVYRPGEEQAPLGSVENMTPVGQPGIVDTFPPPTSSAPVDSELAGAASAAAGIAGAFGVASARSRDDLNGNGQPQISGNGHRVPPVADPDLEPATAFWTSDFEPSGNLDLDQPPPQVSNGNGNASAALWQAHTAADASPLEPAERSWQPEPVSSRPEVDAPTERLPIYEAVLSQWFRADEGAEAQEAAQAAAAPPQAEAPVQAQPQPPQTPPAEQAADLQGGLPTRVPGKAGAAAGFGLSERLSGNGNGNGSANGSANGNANNTGATNNGTNGNGSSNGNGRVLTPQRNGNGAAATNGHSNGNGGNGNAATSGDGFAAWSTPADEGWQRAEALLTPVSDVTQAGLPKRVPKAHLVPGSAAPRDENVTTQNGAGGTQTTLATPLLPPRSADAVRGRMSSFQQGLRRGRHTMIEAYSGEASHPSAHRADEEQE